MRKTIALCLLVVGLAAQAPSTKDVEKLTMADVNAARQEQAMEIADLKLAVKALQRQADEWKARALAADARCPAKATK